MLVGRASPWHHLCSSSMVLLIVAVSSVRGQQCGGVDPTCHGVGCASAPYKNFTCPQGKFCGQADVSLPLSDATCFATLLCNKSRHAILTSPCRRLHSLQITSICHAYPGLRRLRRHRLQ